MFVTRLVIEQLVGQLRICLLVGRRCRLTVKSVLLAIPQYIMMCYLLPDRILVNNTKEIVRLWWTQKGRSGCNHWVSGRTLFQPKLDGGLQFRDLKAVDVAFLLKQVNQIISEPDSL